MKNLAWMMIPLLAACGEQASKAPEPKAPDVEDVAATPAPDTLETPIPAAFAGRWGLVPADCTSILGDNKGLITVSADNIRFYEANATLTTTTAKTPRSVAGAFGFTGEGTTWSRDMKLELSEDGKTLTRSEFGPDAAVAPLKYTRCEAEAAPTP